MKLENHLKLHEYGVEELPHIEGETITQFLVRSGCAKSMREAKHFVSQGTVKVFRPLEESFVVLNEEGEICHGLVHCYEGTAIKAKQDLEAYHNTKHRVVGVLEFLKERGY